MTGMIASSFLPETFCQTLPETIEAANNFGKGNKFWSFVPTNNDVFEGTEKTDDGLGRLKLKTVMNRKDCNNSNQYEL